MKKPLFTGLFVLVLYLFALVLLFKYLPRAEASQEKWVSISDVKISQPTRDAALQIYEVRVTLLEKSDANIKLTRACLVFIKNPDFCIPVIERGNEAITWVTLTGRPHTHQMSVYLEYEYVVAGEREPKRGRSNEVATTIVVRE